MLIKQKYYILLIAVFFIPDVQSQPVITSSINPQPGENYLVKTGGELSTPNYALAGPNQTWNFSSNLVFNPTIITHYAYVAVSSTGHSSAYPTSTVASKDMFNNYIFYTAGTDSIFIDGDAAGVSENKYSDRELLFTYPLTYQYTHTDNFESIFQRDGEIWERTGSVTVTADGYGTLVLNTGSVVTYTNLLRIKLLESITDSAQDGNPVKNITRTVYYWYSANDHFPVFYYETYTGLSNPVILLNALAGVGTGDLQNGATQLLIYPNPAVSAATLEFTLVQPSNVHIQWQNVSGQTVAEFPSKRLGPGTYSEAMDVSGLEKGIYVIWFNMDGRKNEYKMVVK